MSFLACAGSAFQNLFCLVAYSFNQRIFSETLTTQVKNSYFPWVQGLHILLDWPDRSKENRLNGDLNFCFYYKGKRYEMMERFEAFYKKCN
jgi:tetraprenyl-beta-curcumene synthase